MRGSMRRLVSAGMASALLAGSFATGTATASALSVPAATWEPCFTGVEGATYECDVVRVPLDYDNPGGRKISIAMTRIPAGDPAHRIGSLFLNPGGPGGSGVEFLVGAGQFLFTQAVRDRFDLVGFDPRGIMRSNGLRCFESPKEWGPYFTPFAFPINSRQTKQWVTADHYLDAACADRGNRILNHMSTANVARDLDVLRQAVGDAKLTYYGVSYGTMIGQTYANMFPNSFRALIVDGVLDPIAWTTGRRGQNDVPFSTRLRSDAGAMATLKEFFRLCDSGEGCAFAPHSARRYKALAEGLINHAIFIEDPETGDTVRFIYQDLISISLGAMYNSASWGGFGEFLADLESEASARELGRSLASLKHTIGIADDQLRGFPEDPAYPNFVEGFPGVACSDASDPNSYKRWTEAGASAGEVFGYFGRLWTWASSICAQWPGHDDDRYTGPFDHWTNKPVLVVGTIFDPATRYHGAEIAHDLLPNSALLTMRGWQHGALFASACIDDAEAAYLIHGTVPPEGTVCQADATPFAGSAASAAGAASREAASRFVTGRLVPQTVIRSLR